MIKRNLTITTITTSLARAREREFKRKAKELTSPKRLTSPTIMGQKGITTEETTISNKIRGTTTLTTNLILIKGTRTKRSSNQLRLRLMRMKYKNKLKRLTKE